jgi:hypothetical protein
MNILSVIHGRIYFPTYANDLKNVAGCLGFRWSVADASGLRAIVWRHEWEDDGDEATKQRLLTYNQEDCSALEAVVTAVRSLGSEEVMAGGPPGPLVADVDEIGGPAFRKYGRTEFALPEFAGITKCAYFDYQRDKVLCRTDPSLRRSLRRKKERRSTLWRVNQEVECERPQSCPACGSRRLDQQSRHQKLVIDLKPFRGGVKRWVTRYRAKRYRCPNCSATCLPEDYLAHSSKYGWRICGWMVYASIAQRQSNDAVVEGLDDLFGIRVESGYVSKIRRRAVEYYRPAYNSLLSSLRAGHLVHADETKARMMGPKGDGYVWTFASPDTAVYIYAPTRDGTTAQEALIGFKGVLVTDFYAAYDAIDCPQQKCLIHLIRDLNDDLLKNPFDDELKQLAAEFTAVLQPVIETIDRFGLKKYHLTKHRREVERFFDAEVKAEYQSELARHYRTRLMKYRDKLFTFLDHDGVPWNNNNAENAIKLFASRRNSVRTRFTEDGIRDYLLLLSIYQTIRYRHLSFWKFLISGEIDIAAFAASRR